VRVAFDRLPGWIARYDDAHRATKWSAGPEEVRADSQDGTRVRIVVPLPPLKDETVGGLLEHLARPWQVGIILARKGGCAVVRLSGSTLVESKLGRRHVQGRTKAGGWSQQRFARRRDNQAKAAFDATAEHVEQLLVPHARTLELLAVGGDRQALAAVLAHPRLAPLAGLPQVWLGGVADPTRAVVDAAVARLRMVEIEITDPTSADAAGG
jgi:hypothetical protein